MSFQITILKVLAGHPDGCASVTELTRYVSVLMSSGSDWSDRMRRLAARAPKLEIFADSFVLRDDRGWCITDSGRQFLASLEALPVYAEEQEQPSGPRVTVVTAPSQAQPTLRLVVDNTRTSQPDLMKHGGLRDCRSSSVALGLAPEQSVALSRYSKTLLTP